MPKLIHTSRVRIEKDKGPHRQAYIEGFEAPVHFGIKEFYGAEPEAEFPATLDYIVGAVGV